MSDFQETVKVNDFQVAKLHDNLSEVAMMEKYLPPNKMGRPYRRHRSFMSCFGCRFYQTKCYLNKGNINRKYCFIIFGDKTIVCLFRPPPLRFPQLIKIKDVDYSFCPFKNYGVESQRHSFQFVDSYCARKLLQI